MDEKVSVSELVKGTAVLLRTGTASQAATSGAGEYLARLRLRATSMGLRLASGSISCPHSVRARRLEGWIKNLTHSYDSDPSRRLEACRMLARTPELHSLDPGGSALHQWRWPTGRTRLPGAG